MRVYNGWVLRIGCVEFVVAGSQKLRGVQSYVLRATHGVRRISRPASSAAKTRIPPRSTRIKKG